MLEIILDVNLMHQAVDQELEVMQKAILEIKCQILDAVNCKEKIFIMNIFFIYGIIFMVKLWQDMLKKED